MTTLVLRKGAEKRLRAGHHWLYNNEVDVDKTPLKTFAAGSIANVSDWRGKTVGSFMINPHALICGRLISRQADRSLTRSLLKSRLKQALALRESLFPTSHYRWVYGDSDGLSGLVVDRFGDVLSVQISTAAMEAEKELIIDLLTRLVQPTGIVLKNDGKMRSVEGLDSYVEVVFGDVPDTIELVENGVRFEAPIMTGQKTGWFYDHRPNRALAAEWSKGKRVLDVFSYLGGWGVTCAAAGAESVLCSDVSELALAGVESNAALNGVSERVTTRLGDAFEVMAALLEERAKFDVVIIDPPAFIARRKDIESGERAYRRLNELAVRLVEPGGLLVSGSCSMHLAEDRLRDIVRASSRARERHAQILHEGSQGADHPVLPAVPETRYIKALFARILPAL